MLERGTCLACLGPRELISVAEAANEIIMLMHKFHRCLSQIWMMYKHAYIWTLRTFFLKEITFSRGGWGQKCQWWKRCFSLSRHNIFTLHIVSLSNFFPHRVSNVCLWGQTHVWREPLGGSNLKHKTGGERLSTVAPATIAISVDSSLSPSFKKH